MKPRARITPKTVAVITLGLGIASALVGGAYLLIQPRIGGDMSALLGVPTSGNVRVVTTPIETGTDKLHYKWSLIGSSNWRKASGTGTDFVLSDTYPLNSATERGGCHIYEADLTADKASGKWAVTLHGSDGTTVNTEGALPAGKPVSSAIQISQTAASARVGTPNNITLAQIDGKPLRLSVAR
ncbi:MAG: hypothetical protein H7145_03105 [Akkermansiaceae bacterium]|nr:hypothetical protein [Armatimonadota bacterium]